MSSPARLCCRTKPYSKFTEGVDVEYSRNRRAGKVYMLFRKLHYSHVSASRWIQKRFPKNIVADVESILRHCQVINTKMLHARRLVLRHHRDFSGHCDLHAQFCAGKAPDTKLDVGSFGCLATNNKCRMLLTYSMETSTHLRSHVIKM